MAVIFDTKAGAFRIDYAETIGGKRIRRTKRLPIGLTEAEALAIERVQLDPTALLRDRLAAAISGADERPGDLYAISNPYLPGLIKIGMSCNSVHERVRNLSTAYPADWQIVRVAPVKHPLAIERCLHQHFASVRVAKNREFFRLTEAEIAPVLDLAYAVDGVDMAVAISAIR